MNHLCARQHVQFDVIRCPHCSIRHNCSCVHSCIICMFKELIYVIHNSYKLQIIQEFKPKCGNNSVKQCFHYDFWMSNEAHFHLNVSTQNLFIHYYMNKRFFITGSNKILLSYISTHYMATNFSYCVLRRHMV